MWEYQIDQINVLWMKQFQQMTLYMSHDGKLFKYEQVVFYPL